MARRPHFASDPSGDRGTPLTPDEQTKVEFSRHLSKMLRERNWSQSDLWRASIAADNGGGGIGKDAISGYINGRSFPSPKSITLLAKSFGITEAEVFPNGPINATRDELPSFEIKVAAGHPNKAWVRISRMMSFGTAAKIANLINEEDEQAASE